MAKHANKMIEKNINKKVEIYFNQTSVL